MSDEIQWQEPMTSRYVGILFKAHTRQKGHKVEMLFCPVSDCKCRAARCLTCGWRAQSEKGMWK